MTDNPENPAMFGEEDDEFLKETVGCVVRTFSSIAGEPATHGEYMDRVRQIFRSRPSATFKIGENLSDEEHEAKEDLALQESEPDIIDLFRAYQTHPTPMGTSLAGLEVTSARAPISEYKKRITEGEKVAIRIPGHMFHLGEVDGGLVQVSDGNKPLELPLNSDKLYRGLVFRPIQADTKPTQS